MSPGEAEVLAATVGGWRRAYNNEPATVGESAVGTLLDALSAADAAGEDLFIEPEALAA